MLPHFVTQQSQKPEDLQKAVDQQREHGGRLIAYDRFWAFIVLTEHQPRIVWVRSGDSRFLAGLPFSAFTLFLGAWSLLSVLFVPITLLRNTLGGTDVTEFYSTTMTDPLRYSLPIPGTAAREEQRFKRILAVLLCLVIAGCVVFIFQSLQ